MLTDVLNEFPVAKSIFSYGYLGLDLFFIISGFVIPYAMFRNNYELKKFPVFLLKRITRIEPPYIISFLLIILLRVIYAHINNGAYLMDWKQFGLHFFYLNQYFGYSSYTWVYWTLAIEFQFYLLIGILFPIITSSIKIFSLALFIFFCIVIWHLNLHYDWFVFQYGYLFITGILISLLTIRYISLRTFILLLIPLLILIYFKNGLPVLLTAVFGSICILTIKGQWKVTDFLGKISYSFYLVHLESAGWFINFMRPAITNEIALRICSILFALVFATAFYFLFERPSIKISKRIGFKKVMPALVN
jgi:peptidoglycan/LPS O-acetylase OafA/YrhL